LLENYLEKESSIATGRGAILCPLLNKILEIGIENSDQTFPVILKALAKISDIKRVVFQSWFVDAMVAHIQEPDVRDLFFTRLSAHFPFAYAFAGKLIEMPASLYNNEILLEFFCSSDTNRIEASRCLLSFVMQLSKNCHRLYATNVQANLKKVQKFSSYLNKLIFTITKKDCQDRFLLESLKELFPMHYGFCLILNQHKISPTEEDALSILMGLKLVFEHRGLIEEREILGEKDVYRD
jgi:hypothetical protein